MRTLRGTLPIAAPAAAGLIRFSVAARARPAVPPPEARPPAAPDVVRPAAFTNQGGRP